MNDKNQVMFDIERCICHVPDACRDCSKYKGIDVDGLRCMEELMTDALALLKKQEAVAPIYEEGEDFLNYFMKHTMGRCGHCKAPLPALEGMRSKFCWMCGRQVKWDDR